MSAIITQLAPIVLFVYNRPGHTRKTLEALARNDLAEQSRLYIYADAPKASASSDDIEANKTVKKLITEFQWPGSKQIVERSENYGLARNIVEGVTEIIDQFGKIIVLEDDLVTSHGFLLFMNSCLNKLEDEKKVAGVSGYCHNFDTKITNNYYFRAGSSWGWGTWGRAWACYNDDANQLLNEISRKNLIKRFNIDGNRNFFKMLKDTKAGLSDSWAIKFYASYFLRNMLFYFPSQTLVENIGHDDSGIHSGKTNNFDPDYLADYVEYQNIEIKENKIISHLFAKKFNDNQSKWMTLINVLKSIKSYIQNFK